MKINYITEGNYLQESMKILIDSQNDQRRIKFDSFYKELGKKISAQK